MMGYFFHRFIYHSSIWRSGKVWWLLLLSLLSTFLWSGCTTIDERDECCEEVVLHFRYSRGAMDEFPTNIHRMDYFIFDEGERLVYHIAKGEGNLQRLSLRQVDAGRYQVVAIGNATERSAFIPQRTHDMRLSDLLLEVTHQLREGVQGDSDPLYYGIQAYEVKPLPTPQHFLCDMSNVHCLLVATFRWVDTPPSDGVTPFAVELIDVAKSYHLGTYYKIGVSGRGLLHSSEERVVHSFPSLLVTAQYPLIKHQKEALYQAGRVRAELMTLRYTDQQIPMIRLLQGGKEVMRPLSLAKIFRDFKWAVSDNIEQRYELQFLLYDNGRIEVRGGDQLQVLDWINGGTIG